MDELAPVAATVAVDRRAPVKSSRSTLATMADLEPYLAGLFGREATPTCPTCGLDAVDTSPNEAAARLAESHQGARAIVTYGIAVDDAEQFLEVREQLAKSGYRRLVVGGAVREIDDVRPSEATSPGVRVEVVVDRVTVRPSEARRLQEAIETAWTHGAGRAELRVDAGSNGATPGPVTVRRGLVCPKCARQSSSRRARGSSRTTRHAVRGVRRVPRLRPGHRRRLGQGHPRSEQDPRGRRHQAVERSEHDLGAGHPREVLQRSQDPPRRRVAGPRRGAPGARPRR